MATTGYLRDLINGTRLDWQFNPEDIPVTVGANWSEKQVRGGSFPRQHYTGGKGREGKIDLVFIRQELDAGDIERIRRQLEALPLPDYDGSGRLRQGPHPVLLVFGGHRTLRVIITSVELKSGPWFDPDTTTPGELRATLEWKNVPVNGDLSRDDVLAGR